MDEQTLGDDQIETTGSAATPAEEGDTDGTDGDTDGTDGGDTDGTDGGDTDGTDGDADGTDAS